MALRLSHTIKRPALLFVQNIHNFCPLIINPTLSCYQQSTFPSNSLCASHFSSLSKDTGHPGGSAHSPLPFSTFSFCSGNVNVNASCSFVPSRQYGRKVKPKPQKITFFEYSGDLRTLPELDKDELLYPYLDHKADLERDEITKKLASVGFASEAEKNKHMQQLVQDRIIELFGPDSELEQRIARFTLRIRQMIPYCIQNRTDKLQKIWLLKAIFHRRRLLTSLRELDHERFEWLLRELKIRYVIPQDQEEWKGWKHNLQEATKDDTLTQKRKKLEDFKSKLAAEKEEFAQRKANILAEINRDLEKFGLGQDFLDEVQRKEVERKLPHKILSWEERVKLGMTDRIKDYYG